MRIKYRIKTLEERNFLTSVNKIEAKGLFTQLKNNSNKAIYNQETFTTKILQDTLNNLFYGRIKNKV